MAFRAFAQGELRGFLAGAVAQLKGEIQSQSDDYLRNVSETDFVQYLKDKYTFGTLTVDSAKVYVTTYEADIPAERFPSPWFHVNPGERYRRDVLVYHVPFSGPELLLELSPSTRILWSTEVDVRDNEILFEVIRFTDDAAQIKQEADGTIKNICTHAGHVNSEVAGHNGSLEQVIKGALAARHAHFDKRDKVLAALGVPIRSRANVSSTFAVPSPARRAAISVVKPAATKQRPVPEPTLLEDAYQAILRVIHDVGKGFERLPSTYAGKGEEDLRDHLLLISRTELRGNCYRGDVQQVWQDGYPLEVRDYQRLYCGVQILARA